MWLPGCWVCRDTAVLGALMRYLPAASNLVIALFAPKNRKTKVAARSWRRAEHAWIRAPPSASVVAVRRSIGGFSVVQPCPRHHQLANGLLRRSCRSTARDAVAAVRVAVA
jgi:hypothetical protein